MRTRFAWPALLALAFVLAGCTVTVVSVDYAPGSLRGRTLVLTNDTVTRGALVIPTVLKYHFNSSGQVLDRELNPASSGEYTKTSSDVATVTMTIVRNRRGAAREIERTTCRLTFQGSNHGTHRCNFELADTVAFLTVTASGRATGTFRIEPLATS